MALQEWPRRIPGSCRQSKPHRKPHRNLNQWWNGCAHSQSLSTSDTQPFALSLVLFSPFHSAQTHKTMETLLSLIPAQRGLTSDTAVIVPGGQEISYGDLRVSTLSFRDILRKVYGVKTGDVVGMSLSNSAEFVIAFMAIGTARRVQSLTTPTCNYLLVN